MLSQRGLHVLIIEDEDLAVRKLRKLIAEAAPELVIQGVTGSIEESVTWLRENTAPDIIFMDIELSDGQSFEIFNQVKIKSRVIFTTSYDEYVMPAFRVNYVDYLLKPILKEDLQRILQSTPVPGAENSSGEQPAFHSINIEKFLNELNMFCNPFAGAYSSQFLARQGQKILAVETGDILYFYEDTYGCFCYTRSGEKMRIDYALDELAGSMLDPGFFFRINDRLIVSHEAVGSVHQLPGSQLSLALRPGHETDIVVSKNKAAAFRKWYLNRSMHC